jgi:hypothetical protein
VGNECEFGHQVSGNEHLTKTDVMRLRIVTSSKETCLVGGEPGYSSPGEMIMVVTLRADPECVR